MNKTLRNSVSALMDQEASEFEARKVVGVSKSKSEILSFWAASHAVGSLMRGEEILDSSRLLERINSELDGEGRTTRYSDISTERSKTNSTALPTNSLSGTSMREFSSQIAVAMSIAFAVIIGAKILAPVPPGVRNASAEPLEIIKFQLPVQKETVSVEGATTTDKASDRQLSARILSKDDMKRLVRNRLSPYLVRHAENSAVIGGTSVLPLARIMGRDTPIE